jgi:hypothetical protein
MIHQIIKTYSSHLLDVNLDPNSNRFISLVIGDQKLEYSSVQMFKWN